MQSREDSRYYVHKLADVHTASIGYDTNIWQFSVVLAGAIIGENCNICSHVLIEAKVVIGNDVTIKNGVQLWDGVIIEDSVFIGPNVTFTNDKYPRSKKYLNSHPKTIIKKGASIGGGSTILPGITIGEYSMVGAGSVVTKNVEPNSLVLGNPAKMLSQQSND